MSVLERKHIVSLFLITCIAAPLLLTFQVKAQIGPFLSEDVRFKFETGLTQPPSGPFQPYMAAYMTTDYLDNNPSYVEGGLSAIRVTVTFSGTDKSVIQSDNALSAGIAAQGPHSVADPAWIDWGYLLLLVLDGAEDSPYIEGLVWKCYEWGLDPIWDPNPVASLVSKWTWRYPDVLSIDSQVTLSMWWSSDKLNYNATINGVDYALYSYTPEQYESHYFMAGTENRHDKLGFHWPGMGTVKWLQFPGAWSPHDITLLGWSSHLSFPSYICTGDTWWTNVNFSYSVDGWDSWLDNTAQWGGNRYLGVNAHYFNEPWSLPPSESVNQVFFYPNGSYTLPLDTLLWSVDPVNVTIQNVVPILPNYDTVQVYHDGMRLNGEWLSMNYSVTVARTDLSTDVAILLITAGIKRTNIQDPGDYRVIDTVTVAMCAGQVQTFNLTWRETSTMRPGTWEISGFVDLFNPKKYWDTNMTDNQVVNDTVEAKELIGDINGDGIVDIYDAIRLSGAFNSHAGGPRWAPDADLNKDGVVDIYDAIIFANHFGQFIGNGLGGLGSGRSSNGVLRAATAGTPSVVVDPAQLTVFKGEVFTVNVEVTSVTDLLGWEFKLYWNSTLLNCTNFVIQTPTEWQGNAQNYGEGLEAGYNATHARLWIAQTAKYPAPSFNGSMTLATLTFQALQPGTTTLALMETKLGNSTADPIDHTESSGSVSVDYGRYLRSDTQQVNGLSAYKLNIPQSTSSALYTQSGSGAGALFGIRAWVRHSNGVEQEISLDGQTGTPKATVGGGWAGIRSSTVSVAQTALQSTDSLVVRVYVQIAGGPWNLCATFTTEQLHASTLKATVWTVYYYTSSTYNRVTDRTTAKFYWGTTTYNSRIQNLQFS